MRNGNTVFQSCNPGGLKPEDIDPSLADAGYAGQSGDAPPTKSTKQSDPETDSEDKRKMYKKDKSKLLEDYTKANGFLETKIADIKKIGNNYFKEKLYELAKDKFSEGIKLSKLSENVIKLNKDLSVKVAQLYTNRALAYHMLGK